jgi:hypothetical protein
MRSVVFAIFMAMTRGHYAALGRDELELLLS